jgi:undecaprenyl-diphosphatase
VKTVFDAKTGELLGAHMIGAEVTEMIQGYVVGKTLETTEAELMHTVFPHPTLSEMMHESGACRLWARDPHLRRLMLGVLALAMMWRGLGRQWLWLAAVSLIAMLLNTALKHLFAAARPEILAHLDPTMTYSFPSGHASGNAVFLGALAMLWPSRAGSAVALALIGMIGISRVWLGVHWPSDVVCGWIEGAAILLLARRWQPARSPA